MLLLSPVFIFDLSKAFDLIDHALLLQVLRDYYKIPDHLLKLLHMLW